MTLKGVIRIPQDGAYHRTGITRFIREERMAVRMTDVRQFMCIDFISFYCRLILLYHNFHVLLSFVKYDITFAYK